MRDVRPRNIGAVIDDALAMYRGSYKQLLFVSAIFVFPAALIAGLGQDFYLRGFTELIGSSVNTAAEPSAAFVNTMMISYMVMGMAAQVLALGRAYLDSSVLRAAPGMLYAPAESGKSVLKGGLARFGWYLLVVIVVELIIGAAAVASFFVLGAGAIAAWAAFSLAGVICVVEDANLVVAIQRSMALVKGSYWRVIGYLLLVSALTAAFEGAIGSPAIIRQLVASLQNPEAVFQPLSVPWKVFEGLTLGIAIALPAPFIPLAMFSLYLDLRARKEGMDIIVRARELTPSA